MKERKVGEVFKADGVKLKVVEENSCNECYCFQEILACVSPKIRNKIGLCCASERNDLTSVIFKKVVL